MAGLRIPADVVANHKDMREGNQQFTLYKLDDTGEELVIDRRAEGKNETTREIFEYFVEQLPEDDCRFAIYDYRYINADEVFIRKLLFILWCPETVSYNLKQTYTAAKSTLRQKLSGINKELYIAYPEDLEYDEIQQLMTS